MTRRQRHQQLVRLLQAAHAEDQTLTAEQLAFATGVSVRTIYRDVQALYSAGVPIVGEAGLGYELRRSAPVAMLRLTVDQLALLASDRLEKAEMAELRAALQWPTGEAQRAFGY